MGEEVDVSRRKFLRSSGTITGASLLRIGAPSLAAITQAACTAKQETSPFMTLSAADAADFAAIAARIIPTTDTPGATEAGVIHFFDRALGAELQGMLDGLLAQLADLNSEIVAANSGVPRFADLDEAQQDERLAAIETESFFQSVWHLTMFGFFAMSQYGGNKGNVAWDLIGFEGDHGPWQYPFGHYDAEYAAETASG